MVEKRPATTKEIVWLAHALKFAAGNVKSTEYDNYVNKMRWTDLGSKTIAESIRNKKIKKVIDVVSQDLSGGYQ